MQQQQQQSSTVVVDGGSRDAQPYQESSRGVVAAPQISAQPYQQQQQSSSVVVGVPQGIQPLLGSPVTHPVTDFLDKQCLVLAVCQIIIGVLCVIFNVAAMGIYEWLSFVGHGIWCGIFVSGSTIVDAT